MPKSDRYSTCEVLVQGTLPPWPTGESSCQLPKATEILCPKCVEAPPTESAEEEIPLQVIQGYQVLPNDDPRLGRSWTAGLQAGLQHAQSAHPP